MNTNKVQQGIANALSKLPQSYSQFPKRKDSKVGPASPKALKDKVKH